ncbi:uncharacterized protein LACBIDRAFT_326768 [Laccaria bicolor S238N-H82]|uniref:Predicted protein n=1 Tax=Laccaria bicolor (strain S238N-H82 / ATCC MYA-4686) TaxID=486041 RepID=B0D9L8_LACBS|nr:uncharacterized protein LACBIDRAFT_326768 [Laccaria bicolor S238N-H82]EDR08374.1 predicted protein [Laccaria bicolor S238N-H82]|eukprot:XP_001880599.1 predicted protein [Laccaria bicolor S238N-H82]
MSLFTCGLKDPPWLNPALRLIPPPVEPLCRVGLKRAFLSRHLQRRQSRHAASRRRALMLLQGRAPTKCARRVLRKLCRLFLQKIQPRSSTNFRLWPPAHLARYQEKVIDILHFSGEFSNPVCSRLCTHATSWQHNHRASRLKPRLNVEFLKLGQKLEAFYSPSASTDALPTISCRVTEAKSASYLTVERSSLGILFNFHEHVGADSFSVIALRRLLLKLRSFFDAEDEAGAQRAFRLCCHRVYDVKGGGCEVHGLLDGQVNRLSNVLSIRVKLHRAPDRFALGFKAVPGKKHTYDVYMAEREKPAIPLYQPTAATLDQPRRSILSCTRPSSLDVAVTTQMVLSNLRRTSPIGRHHHDPAYLPQLEELLIEITQQSQTLVQHFRDKAKDALKEIAERRKSSERIDALRNAVSHAATGKLTPGLSFLVHNDDPSMYKVYLVGLWEVDRELEELEEKATPSDTDGQDYGSTRSTIDSRVMHLSKKAQGIRVAAEGENKGTSRLKAWLKRVVLPVQHQTKLELVLDVDEKGAMQ